MARASLKRVGYVRNGVCEPGEALQNANYNSEIFKDALSKQTRELRAAKEEAALKQERLRAMKTDLTNLRERKARLAESLEKEKRERKVSESERTLQRKRDALREKLDVLNRKLEEIATTHTSAPAVSSLSLEETTRQVELFTHRLGLRVSKVSGGRLRVGMRYIDPKEPEREFTFRVQTGEDALEYEIDNVQPPIKGLEEMVKELNESGDFSYFCRAMRRRFRDTCQ